MARRRLRHRRKTSLTAPFIPVLLSGGPKTIKKDGREINVNVKGKEEEWTLALYGTVLREPHPTWADRQSALQYAELLQEEYAGGTLKI